MLSAPLARPVAMTMCARTFSASSSYLYVNPQLLGKVYSVDWAGTSTSANAAVGPATSTAAVVAAVVCKKLRRVLATAESCCEE